MPDTGAPWNLPYIAASDLVKDWPTDNQQQIEAIADALSIGLGSNVVQTVKTDTFTTTSATFTPVTGLNASITPSSATSKVLVIAQGQISNTGANATHLRLTRAASAIYVGDAASNRVQTGATFLTTANQNSIAATLVFLDSPATTSSVTYEVEMTRDAGTATLGRTGNDPDTAAGGRVPSSLTLIEVAA